MLTFISKKSQVSNEAKLSRQGEGFFLSLLSKYAILHKVEGGNDIGIDYFCEWINQEKSESTNVLFAVQLKTTRENKVILKNLKTKDSGKSNLNLYEIKKIKKDKLNGNFDNSIRPETKEYWRGFEIPVYLFVVVLGESEKNNKLFYKRYTPILHKTDKNLKFFLVNDNKSFIVYADNINKTGGFCRDLYIDYIRCNYKKGAIYYRDPRDFGLNQFRSNRGEFFFGDMVSTEYINETKKMIELAKIIEKFLADSLTKKRMDLLINFINTSMTVRDYLNKDEPLIKELLKYSSVVTEDDLGDSKNHELEHKKVWDKYNIKSEFRRELIGEKRVFVFDTNFDEKARTMNKIRVIEILKEVCFAAYKAGHSFESCKSDLILYEVLSKRQHVCPLNKKDWDRLEKIYKN